MSIDKPIKHIITHPILYFWSKLKKLDISSTEINTDNKTMQKIKKSGTAAFINPIFESNGF